jgi:cellulose synthase (UDP-forming)
MMGMSGAGSSQNFFLDMPLTKVISAANLNLRFAAPLVRSGESWLDIWLNGTRVASIPLTTGLHQLDVPLPADLLTSNNTLTFQLQGKCAACARSRAAWLTIGPKSQLNLRGTRLALPNNLALLPVPFFDSALQRSWSLPIVFSDRPGVDELKAASVVASWFGIFSDFRGVRFPVTVGELPEGNAVVFVLRNSELGTRLSLPAKPGAMLAIRENPRDPYGKLLIVAGDRPEELLTAARALVTRNNAQSPADTVYVSSVGNPRLRAYQAPRWLDANKAAPIGMYTTDERLRLRGSGSIAIYFRIPPDLFLQARDSVPLILKYTYAGVGKGSQAALHLRLNDRDIDSVRLRPAFSATEDEKLIRLPTGRFQPYTNTLTIDVNFGRKNVAVNTGQFFAVHRDSSVDLSGLPHSVVLPRLELFADSGYPFTAWPDLGRTAVALSQAPTTAEYEILFDMMGFCGAQTGATVMNVSITDASHLTEASDKDLVLLGTPDSQPMFAQWAEDMPVDLRGELRLSDQLEVSRILHPEWPFRGRDREKLATLLATKPPLDLIVEDFVSPLRADRSVVAIAPQGETGLDAIASLFTPAVDKGPIYGGVSVAQSGRFESFLVGELAYHSGHLDAFQQTRVFLIEHYLFIPLLVVLLAFMLAGGLYASTERIAARRLAAAEHR